MKRKQLLNTVCLSVALLLALALQWSDARAARVVHQEFDAAYASDIRVWLDRDIDIYQPEDALVFNVQAVRDCYATVFAVDTEGYLHILYPFSPDEEVYLRGGIVYSFTPVYRDIFFSAGSRGIAFVFAVASPSPFVYSHYDYGIFAGSWGYRVYGNPFIACRNFYFSLLPPRIVIERVSINFTYFYVREWVRYPRYLCYSTYNGRIHFGRPYHSHYASYCQNYRMHLHDPYSVIGPTRTVDPRDGDRYSRVARVEEKHRRHIQERHAIRHDGQKAVRVEVRKNVVPKSGFEKGIRSTSRSVQKETTNRTVAPVASKSTRKTVTVKHTYRPEKNLERGTILKKSRAKQVKETTVTAMKQSTKPAQQKPARTTKNVGGKKGSATKTTSKSKSRR